jgi:3-isopropylmalate dehydrogenase
VIVRENTEGLYASRGAGMNLRGEVATDTLVVTRKGVERVARFSVRAVAPPQRGAPRDGQRRVTVCDKANILRSYAFFRAVCDEVARATPTWPSTTPMPTRSPCTCSRSPTSTT